MHGVNAPIIRSLLPACLLHVACADDEGATNVALQQVSFEAVPTPLFELGALQAALDGATYAELGAFTAATRDEALPQVVAAVGLTERMLDTEMTPGGFALTTNPSLRRRGRGRTDGPAGGAHRAVHGRGRRVRLAPRRAGSGA